MKRRDFLAAVAATTTSAALNGQPTVLAKDATSVNRNLDGAGRLFLTPPKEFLFTDLRNIAPGDLLWRGPNGQSIPVAGPPEPPVKAVPDNYAVARGIRLVAQKANKEGPIAGLPGGIICADGLYRAWNLRINYSGKDLGSYSRAPAKSIVVEYSESKDGYAWAGRSLNEISVAGIRSGITGIDGAGFFLDSHAQPDERYKAVFHAAMLGDVADLWEKYKTIHPLRRDLRISPAHFSCLFGLVSADGLHWKLLPELLMPHKGDTDNIVYYDAWLEKYVLYTRYMRYDRRSIARAESKDFRHWDPVQPIIASDLRDPCSYDVYTNARTCYPGLPEQHLMFPFIYRRDTQTSEIHVYSSMDGILWDRVPGGPVLEPSDPPGWDGVFIGASRNLVPLGRDRIGLVYSGSSRPHKYPRWLGVIHGQAGWACWPKGRLVGLVAEQEGQFNTFEVPVTGQKLHVNARVHAGGEIRVGVSKATARQPADCDPISGDSLAHMVTWRGNSQPGIAPGGRTTLRFELRKAELFGFEWGS